MFREISEKFLFLKKPDKSRRKKQKNPDISSQSTPTLKEKTGKNRFQPEKLEFFSEATPTREGEAALIGFLPTSRSPREL